MNNYNQQYDFPIKISQIKAGDILIPGRYAVIRIDTNEPLGIISDKYQLVLHKLVINSFRQALIKAKMKFQEEVLLSNNGAYLNAKYDFLDRREEIVKGDYISMRIWLENSYDTTTSIKFTLGALRFACTNGLVVAERFTSYSQRHTRQVLVKQMTNEIATLSNYFNRTVVHKMRKMSQIKVPKETSEKNFHKYEDNKTYPLWLIQVAKEKYQKEQKTVWEYYNSFIYAIRYSSSRIRIKSQIGYSKKAWNEAIKLTRSLN